MESALASQHEKKGEASPKSEDWRESHPWQEADAREGPRLFLQCNMAVGAPEDEFEREANRVADTVEAASRTAVTLGTPGLPKGRSVYEHAADEYGAGEPRTTAVEKV